MERYYNKMKISRLAAHRTLLVIVDILSIYLSSYLAQWIRFNINEISIPPNYAASIEGFNLINIVVTLIIFAFFKLYTSLWRFASIKELLNIIGACTCSLIFNILLYFMTYSDIYRSYFAIYTVTLFLAVCLTRFSYRLLRLVYRSRLHGENVRNTMIIGAGEACNVTMKELELSSKLDSKIKCVIDDDKRKHGNYIHGVKIVGGREKILESVKKYNITEIIIAIPSASQKVKQEIYEICKQAEGCDLKILPGVYQLVQGDVSVSKLRNVEIEDLLGRDSIKIVNEKVSRRIDNKVVLVTGGGGSIGSELCRQIAANGVKRLIIFDIYENNAYEIQQELKMTFPNLDLVVLIGSVRNAKKLESVFAKYRPNIVYHAAAHKHVPLMEESPNEAVKNNVFGTYETARVADKYRVDNFVLISTDKAVNPTNVMGATKRICEMVIQLFSRHSKTEFVAVRFGNVLGSNGSVIPFFKKQIEAGGPVTVTHPEIIRYFMTIPEAVSLVLQASATARGGEIFVLDMGEPVRILDLAKNLIELSGFKVGKDIEIQFTGLRPGEKLYEELLMDEEGLESTENKLIHIGKPIQIDEADFVKKLEELYKAAYDESESIKELVSEIVPTYYRKKEKLKINKEVVIFNDSSNGNFDFPSMSNEVRGV